MRKLILPAALCWLMSVSISCKTLQGYQLNELDAAAAIRQMLEFGTREGITGAFSRETILSTLFPEDLVKVLNTLKQLGLTQEIERFTTTLGTAAENTASRSIPIFVHGITSMRLIDAIRIVRDGGTAATDYLRSTIGDSLRRAITPVMQQALNEYNLNKQWDDITKPVRAIAGNRLNLDLANLMAGLVSQKMFQKIEEKEQEIRNNMAARTTPLLQRVFGRQW